MPNNPHWFLLLAASAIILVAAITDLRTRRIPNVLTLPAIPVGFVLSYILEGSTGLLASVVGLVLALVIYLPLYALRAMGAGDGKLMAAVSTFIGWSMWLHLFFAASLLGGVVAVVFTMAKGQFRHTLQRSVLVLRSLASFQSPASVDETLDFRSNKSLSLPHGSVIALAWMALLVAWDQFGFRLFELSK